MPNLILGLRRAGKQVAVWVIHQAESLRKGGVLWEKNDLRIISAICPALSSAGSFIELYVRGNDHSRDDIICIYECESEEEARCVCDLIREGVRAINAQSPSEPTEAFAGFEVVE